ncbi:MAG: SagB/ThcOx family dehydrogenase [Candidatus Omnitrophica bacterium]|nr:SagB/ThcOx family dehydrogenase [Candidatus Omnitrophota bacterium]
MKLRVSPFGKWIVWLLILLTGRFHSGMAQNFDRGIVKLPEPRYESESSIEKCLLLRRSVRDFKDEPLTLAQISQLLWAAQGVTSAEGFKTAPSAGATYPLEAYLVAGHVTDLQSGIYQFSSSKHELTRIVDGDKREELARAALGQYSVREAAAIIVFSAVYERTTAQYGDRGVMYVHMEAGHAAQNVALQAVAQDLGTIMIGAFEDDEVKVLMKMEDEEAPVYLIAVGVPQL